MNRCPENMKTDPPDQPKNEQNHYDSPKHATLSLIASLLDKRRFRRSHWAAAIPIGKLAISATVSLP